MRKPVIGPSLLCLVILCLAQPALAVDRFQIDAKHSVISGTIKYTLVGTYRVEFKDFSGTIYFDPDDITHSSVQLNIKTKSLKSKHPRLDRIARSQRLLDTARYPNILFKSRSIKKIKGGYWVKGMVRAHGVTKEIQFPFEVMIPKNHSGPLGYVKAKGLWVINRKNFNIIWNKVLDVGGVVVSDEITVDWRVAAFRK